jgi:hypothetical protein
VFRDSRVAKLSFKQFFPQDLLLDISSWLRKPPLLNKTVSNMCTFHRCSELEILMQFPVKSPELVSVFIEASKNLKIFFLTVKRQKNQKP